MDARNNNNLGHRVKRHKGDVTVDLPPGSYFEGVELDLNRIPLLRDVQHDVLRKLQVRFLDPSVSKHLVVVCNGAGKTGIIAISPFIRGTPQAPCHRTIVIAPTSNALEKLAWDLGEDEFEQSFYQMVGAIPHGTRMPKTTIMTGATTTEEMAQFDIAVCTAELLASRLPDIRDWEACNNNRLFGFVVVDDAHLVSATTLRSILDDLRPPEAALQRNFHVLLLTHTPFRSDGQAIVERPEEIVDPQFTLLSSSSLPSPVTKELVLVMPPPLPTPTEAIARMVCTLLRAKRHESNNTIAHKALGRTKTTREAAAVVELINNLNLPAHSGRGAPVRPMRAAMITSKMPDREAVLYAFRCGQVHEQGCVDILIQCGCLGEDYDHVNISVAGIFTGFGSLPPFAQFIGRVVRRIPLQKLVGWRDRSNKKRTVARFGAQNIGHVVTCKTVVSRTAEPLELWKEFETQQASQLQYLDVLDDFNEHESKSDEEEEARGQEENNSNDHETKVITRFVMAPTTEKREQIETWDNLFDYMNTSF